MAGSQVTCGRCGEESPRVAVRCTSCGALLVDLNAAPTPLPAQVSAPPEVAAPAALPNAEPEPDRVELEESDPDGADPSVPDVAPMWNEVRTVVPATASPASARAPLGPGPVLAGTFLLCAALVGSGIYNAARLGVLARAEPPAEAASPSPASAPEAAAPSPGGAAPAPVPPVVPAAAARTEPPGAAPARSPSRAAPTRRAAPPRKVKAGARGIEVGEFNLVDLGGGKRDAR
jgi:hypothetical protein